MSSSEESSKTKPFPEGKSSKGVATKDIEDDETVVELGPDEVEQCDAAAEVISDEEERPDDKAEENRDDEEEEDDHEVNDTQAPVEEEDEEVHDNGDKVQTSKEEPRGAKRSVADTPEGVDSKKQKQEHGSTSRKVDTSKSNAAAENGKDDSLRGLNNRLPKEGQHVSWKALQGFVEGEVVEILREAKEVDGKSIKANLSDPRIVLKSSSSGKICVHKPEAVYFEDGKE
ncbi:hypothetical protein F5Y16DRAFT_419201 [Xylariaceae sp. FL0255]|nr:hypothetical protein F5Y16DRAFT_419201 [Xylariaceae sp. FL0255]